MPLLSVCSQNNSHTRHAGAKTHSRTRGGVGLAFPGTVFVGETPWTLGTMTGWFISLGEMIFLEVSRGAGIFAGWVAVGGLGTGARLPQFCTAIT